MWARPGHLLGRAAGPASDCGIAGRALEGRTGPAWAALHLTLGRGSRTSPRASLGSLLPTQGSASARSPLFPPLGTHSISTWPWWLLLHFPAKVPVGSLGSGQKESRVPRGHSLSYSGLHSPPHHLAGTCIAVPIREMNRTHCYRPIGPSPLSNLFWVVPCYLLNLAINYFPSTFPPCPHQGLN